MAGGFSFLGGLLALFVGSATSGYVPKDVREKREEYHEIFGNSEPTKEEKAVYDKWRSKYQNQRGEWLYKLASTSSESQKIWWEHVFEDEGVVPSVRFLNRISGVCNDQWNDYMSRRRKRR